MCLRGARIIELNRRETIASENCGQTEYFRVFSRKVDEKPRKLQCGIKIVRIRSL